MDDPWWMADRLWRETGSGIVRRCWLLWAENGAAGAGGARRAMWTGWRWGRMWGTGMWTVNGRARVLRCARRVSCRAPCSVSRKPGVCCMYQDSPWAHVVRRRRSCLRGSQCPRPHRQRARSRSVPRPLSRQSRRSHSRSQSHLYSHSHPH